MMQRAWSHLELPTPGDQYLQSIDHEPGAELCIVGTRETDVLRLCVDVKMRGESEVGVGAVFYGSPGVRGGWLWEGLQGEMALELAIGE